MNNLDKQKYIDRYSKRFDEFGHDPKTLGWGGGVLKQKKRFEIISSIINLNYCSVLDVGCGFGDLYCYLSKNCQKEINYTGVDIIPFLIEKAKEIYPPPHFFLLDIIESNYFGANSFDYVISSGVFNAKIESKSMIEHIKEYITKMFEISKKGVSVDFMTEYVDFKNEIAHHTSPEWAFSFAKTLSKRVCLRHDYFPFEFCLYIYKNDSFTKNTIFTEVD